MKRKNILLAAAAIAVTGMLALTRSVAAVNASEAVFELDMAGDGFSAPVDCSAVEVPPYCADPVSIPDQWPSTDGVKTNLVMGHMCQQFFRDQPFAEKLHIIRSNLGFMAKTAQDSGYVLDQEIFDLILEQVTQLAESDCYSDAQMEEIFKVRAICYRYAGDLEKMDEDLRSAAYYAGVDPSAYLLRHAPDNIGGYNFLKPTVEQKEYLWNLFSTVYSMLGDAVSMVDFCRNFLTDSQRGWLTLFGDDLEKKEEILKANLECVREGVRP